MKIREAVQPELVFLDLQGRNSTDAITAVSDALAAPAGLAADQVGEALLEREELGSTSVGNGFAIPHCKLPNLGEIVVALARFSHGVDFGGTKNHEPVRFFFVVLSPPDHPAEHLQVLSQIARILKIEELRNQLMEARDISFVVEAIHRASEQEGL